MPAASQRSVRPRVAPVTGRTRMPLGHSAPWTHAIAISGTGRLRSRSSACAAVTSGYAGPSVASPSQPVAPSTPVASTETRVVMPWVGSPPTVGSTVTSLQEPALVIRGAVPPRPSAASTGRAASSAVESLTAGVLGRGWGTGVVGSEQDTTPGCGSPGTQGCGVAAGPFAGPPAGPAGLVPVHVEVGRRRARHVRSAAAAASRGRPTSRRGTRSSLWVRSSRSGSRPQGRRCTSR